VWALQQGVPALLHPGPAPPLGRDRVVSAAREGRRAPARREPDDLARAA